MSPLQYIRRPVPFGNAAGEEHAAAASENLDIKALPFMPLPPMPAIFFFVAEHLCGVLVTSNF
jgi:hypothetical protein